MTQIKVYNQDGNVTGEMAAPEFLSGSWNSVLAHQVFKAMAANKRIPVAHTKNRGEVRGGGVKPWRQKGTGRARHGSIRSPLWRHGGVTHGPRNDRDYSQKFNAKMAQLALRGALAKKLDLDQLKIVDKLTSGLKTKNLAAAINNLSKGKSTLLVLNNKNTELNRAAKNLKNVAIIRSENLNLYDVLNHQQIIFEKEVLRDFKNS